MANFTVNIYNRVGSLVVLPSDFVIVPDNFSNRRGDNFKAQLTATGNEIILWSLLGYLKYSIEILDDTGHCVWFGYVSGVLIDCGIFRFGKTLDTMYNAARLLHSSGLSSSLTGWTLDNDSIVEYGRKENQLSQGNTSSVEAAERLESFLLQYGQPVETVDYRGTSRLEAIAIIQCRGFTDLLNWRYYGNNEKPIAPPVANPTGSEMFSHDATIFTPVAFTDAGGKTALQFTGDENERPFSIFKPGDYLKINTDTLVNIVSRVANVSGREIVFADEFVTDTSTTVSLQNTTEVIYQSFVYHGVKPARLKSIKVNLKSIGTPSFVQMRIHGAPLDSDGFPALWLANSGNSVPGSDLSDSEFTEVIFSFSGLTLQPGQTYSFGLSGYVDNSGLFVQSSPNASLSGGEMFIVPYSGSQNRRIHPSSNIIFTLDYTWDLATFASDVFAIAGTSHSGLIMPFSTFRQVEPYRQGDSTTLDEFDDIATRGIESGALKYYTSRDKYFNLEPLPTSDNFRYYILRDGSFRDRYDNPVAKAAIRSGEWFRMKDIGPPQGNTMAAMNTIFVEEASYSVANDQLTIVPRKGKYNL